MVLALDCGVGLSEQGETGTNMAVLAPVVPPIQVGERARGATLQVVAASKTCRGVAARLMLLARHVGLVVPARSLAFPAIKAC